MSAWTHAFFLPRTPLSSFDMLTIGPTYVQVIMNIPTWYLELMFLKRNDSGTLLHCHFPIILKVLEFLDFFLRLFLVTFIVCRLKDKCSIFLMKYFI